MNTAHHTWKPQQPYKQPDEYQGKIPIYHANRLHETNDSDIYETFFSCSGCFIVRGVYTEDLMTNFNKWCEDMLNISNLDKNATHPLQSDKFLINDLIYRMSENNPDMLMELLNNPSLTKIADILLGFMVYGSATAHWINPGGDRQKSHVDYPLHLGSTPFWDNNVEKLQKLVTKYQVNHILPFYSIQILIASDKMDQSNGSTEVIPGSHRIEDIDVHIHNKKVYDKCENMFVNASLEKGDILVFNRRLVHRGGKNTSNYRRNSLIIQGVNLFSIPQEIFNYDAVLTNIENSNEYNRMSSEEKEFFLLRLKQPYPRIVKNST